MIASGQCTNADALFTAGDAMYLEKIGPRYGVWSHPSATPGYAWFAIKSLHLIAWIQSFFKNYWVNIYIYRPYSLHRILFTVELVWFTQVNTNILKVKFYFVSWAFFEKTDLRRRRERDVNFFIRKNHLKFHLSKSLAKLRLRLLILSYLAER